MRSSGPTGTTRVTALPAAVLPSPRGSNHRTGAAATDAPHRWLAAGLRAADASRCAFPRRRAARAVAVASSTAPVPGAASAYRWRGQHRLMRVAAFLFPVSPARRHCTSGTESDFSLAAEGHARLPVLRFAACSEDLDALAEKMTLLPAQVRLPARREPAPAGADGWRQCRARCASYPAGRRHAADRRTARATAGRAA